MGSPTATEPSWLLDRRAHAADAIAEISQPTFRGVVGWEFTPIDKLDFEAFPLGRAGDPTSADEVLAAPASQTALGTPANVAGLTVLPLQEAAQLRPELLEGRLGAAVAASNPFIAHNDAYWSDGWLVHVQAHTQIAEPIVLRTAHQASSLLHHRVLVVLEEGAEAEVWAEQLSSDPEGDGILNSVTELLVGEGAQLRFLDAQGLSERTWVFGAERAVLQRDAQLQWTALGFGSANGKVFLETNLAGPGAGAQVTGAYATRGRQHVDFDTLQEHAAPNTTSDLAFRGILTGRSSTVWRGMIKVDPGAQRTDAFQDSHNLLLSKRAHADAIPGLEILADDVRCTHAAAIAQIDPGQLFYLRSHGLPDQQARRLVIEGFLQALLERFAQGPMRDGLAGALAKRIELVLAGS